jgi:serine/threonine protein kinase
MGWSVMSHCPFCGTATPDTAPTCPNCGASLSGLQLPNHSGLRGGKYRLERVLGQGGFGITYRAYEPGLDRFVAIKELFPEGSSRRGTILIPSVLLGAHGFQEALGRFLEEAKTLAQFNHPGVVRIFEVFEENNTAYLVMEHLSGQTLSARIEATTQLGEIEVRRITTDLCSALRIVHDHNILHRDIKPDNVFLSIDGRVILIDFGSARLFSSGHTVSHTQMVTPGYAAPEQYASSAKFGPYTDLYGLGATLFHAITGKPPPSATDRLMGMALPELPTAISPGVRRAITQSLALKVDERPQTVARFELDLAATSVVDAQRPPPASAPPPLPPQSAIAPLYVRGGVRIDPRSFVASGIVYPIQDIQAIQLQGNAPTRGKKGGFSTESLFAPGCLLTLTFVLAPVGIILLLVAFFGSAGSSLRALGGLFGGNTATGRLALLINGAWVTAYTSQDWAELRDIERALEFAIKPHKVK